MSMSVRTMIDLQMCVCSLHHTKNGLHAYVNTQAQMLEHLSH